MSFVSRQRGEVWFLGVVTAGSLIHEALPRWGELLGRRLSVRGVDLPLDATEPDYERFCADLLASEEAVGAVITSHKAALYAAARQRFEHRADVVGRVAEPSYGMAELTGEINAIRCENSGLLGWASDRQLERLRAVVRRLRTDLPVRLEAAGSGTSWDARVAAAALARSSSTQPGWARTSEAHP